MTSLRAIATLALSLFVFALSVAMAALGTDCDGLFAAAPPKSPPPTSIRVNRIL